MRLVDIDKVPVSDEPQSLDTFFHNPCLVQLPRWAIEAIAKTCSVDTVKHGKWEKISDRNYKCSSCGAWWSVDRDSTIKDFEHCPHCGARMDL